MPEKMNTEIFCDIEIFCKFFQNDKDVSSLCVHKSRYSQEVRTDYHRTCHYLHPVSAKQSHTIAQHLTSTDLQ